MCKFGELTKKKHKCGPFFPMRDGDAKQKINFTLPKAPSNPSNQGDLFSNRKLVV